MMTPTKKYTLCNSKVVFFYTFGHSYLFLFDKTFFHIFFHTWHNENTDMFKVAFCPRLNINNKCLNIFQLILFRHKYTL
jgi:hypothetical protein